MNAVIAAALALTLCLAAVPSVAAGEVAVPLGEAAPDIYCTPLAHLLCVVLGIVCTTAGVPCPR